MTMTTDTQNTVLSQVAVKAPTIILAPPVRCEEGARLVHEWRLAYEAEKDFWKAHAILWKWQPYWNHLKGCEQCQDYEKRRWHS